MAMRSCFRVVRQYQPQLRSAVVGAPARHFRISSRFEVSARSFSSSAEVDYEIDEEGPPKEERFVIDMDSKTIEGLNEDTRRVLSLDNASQAEKNKVRNADIRKQYQRHEADCGSSEVQVAVLNAKILHMTAHLKVHKKDKHSLRGLRGMINKRAKLMKYLKRTDLQRFKAFIEETGMKDNF